MESSICFVVFFFLKLPLSYCIVYVVSVVGVHFKLLVCWCCQSCLSCWFCLCYYCCMCCSAELYLILKFPDIEILKLHKF